MLYTSISIFAWRILLEEFLEGGALEEDGSAVFTGVFFGGGEFFFVVAKFKEFFLDIRERQKFVFFGNSLRHSNEKFGKYISGVFVDGSYVV